MKKVSEDESQRSSPTDLSSLRGIEWAERLIHVLVVPLLLLTTTISDLNDRQLALLVALLALLVALR